MLPISQHVAMRSPQEKHDGRRDEAQDSRVDPTGDVFAKMAVRETPGNCHKTQGAVGG